MESNNLIVFFIKVKKKIFFLKKNFYRKILTEKKLIKKICKQVI